MSIETQKNTYTILLIIKIRWLIDNKQVLFLKDYENSSPQYQNLVNQGA